VEISAEADFGRLLKLEEEFVEKMCNEIAAVKPDLVITEKGVSGGYGLVVDMSYWFVALDLAQHFLMKRNITAIRRVRKTDNNRIARYMLTFKHC